MDEELKKYICHHFKYEDGRIIRDDRKNSNGSLDKDGYLIIKIKGHQFKAHRLVWFLCTGEFPKSEIDHINRDRLDNRIENLRESNRKQQIENSYHKPNPQTGYIGIYEDKFTKGLKKKYVTRINRKIYRFYTVQEAVKFRKEAGLWV